jgi:hypothetical protein
LIRLGFERREMFHVEWNITQRENAVYRRDTSGAGPMSLEFRRGSQWGQLAHGSVEFSTRTAGSRTHAQGEFSASSQNGARRNNVGTAHRHVAALRLVLIIASIDDSVEGMLGMNEFST